MKLFKIKTTKTETILAIDFYENKKHIMTDLVKEDELSGFLLALKTLGWQHISSEEDIKQKEQEIKNLEFCLAKAKNELAELKERRLEGEEQWI